MIATTSLSVLLAQLALPVGIRLLVALLRLGALLSTIWKLPVRFLRLGTVCFARGRPAGFGFGFGGLVRLGSLEDDVDADLRDSVTRPSPRQMGFTHRHGHLLLVGLADAELGAAACRPPDGPGSSAVFSNERSVSCSPRAELLGIRLERDVLLAGLIAEHDGERLGELLELGEGKGGGFVLGVCSFAFGFGRLGLLSCQRSPLRRLGMASEKLNNNL